ncbi:SusD family protein [Filimonas lacunae]|uniref:SusD family protein n=1 Tax=Filimonas lacunae TaxID=477680 RepID=A0A173MN86_9BACT|nr:RagB/SusD family nutrient uptake outer membrane protein [Filimonas lacunae]BAV09103.1 hypothetical protein FLA_5151 [Filimonas lacunae]SIS67320.1 SusD family protein [Filimonas lacunae]
MKALITISMLLLFTCCSKSLLNESPSSQTTEPVTLGDFYALLDNENVMDQTPASIEASADDYFFTDAYFDNILTIQQNTYLWAKDIYQGNTSITDWNSPYYQVLHCNVALEGYNKYFEADRQYEWQNLKATALFKRSMAFYNLAQLFAPPFDSTTMVNQMGIPLRLTASANEPIYRPSVQANYDRIIQDLQEAATLIKQPTPDTSRNRPCKAAVFAALSRVYLSMRNYHNALRYADSSLLLYNRLIDYNTISATSSSPFTVYNAENLYTSKIPSNYFQSILPVIGQAYIDTLLYNSYIPNNDVRKTLFFTTTDNKLYRRKNFYDGTAATLYTGFAVDEMYLVKSECLVRTGNTTEGINWLNQLLTTRYKKNTFTPYNPGNYSEALQIVLQERRKEMVMRGARFTDLRRLNLEGYAISPRRHLHGITYLLSPNSNLYTLPLPPGLNLPQNPR